jgi:cysteine synthase A
MPESISVERRRIMAGYGARILLTPAADGMPGAVVLWDSRTGDRVSN